MRIFIFFVFILIQLKSVTAQDFNEILKSERRIVVKDSMDKMLNLLIDKNEELINRSLTLNDFFIGWSDGEILLKNNKILRGRLAVVRDSKYSSSPTEVKFKVVDTSGLRIYSVNELNGFNKEGTIFRTKILKNQTKIFIEVLETGSINLYFRKYIQPLEDGTKGIRFITEFFIEKPNNSNNLHGPIPSENEVFVLFMESYVKDNPQLLLKIKNKVYKYDQIREIIQVYNLEKIAKS